MSSRHRAREFSIKVLYQIDTCGKEDVEEAIMEGRRLITHRGADIDYSLRLIRGVVKNLKAIDEIIKGAAEHWSLERMDTLVKNILRIATFELLYCKDIPYKVSIDEAVELGKRFGRSDSPTFINGVLDSIAKKKAKELAS